MYDWWRPFDLFNLINFFLTLLGKIKAIKLLHGLYYKQKWILHKCNHCLFDTCFTVTGLQPEKTPAVTDRVWCSSIVHLSIHTGRSSHSWLFFISSDGCIRSNFGIGNPGIALWRWKPNVTNQMLISAEKEKSGNSDIYKRNWETTMQSNHTVSEGLGLVLCLHINWQTSVGV